MRWIGFLCLGVVVLAGCARHGAPPPGEQQAALPPPVTGEGEEDPAWRARADGPVYRGKSATQWAQQLDQADEGTRFQAGMALRNLGEAGYPHLKNAMSNRSPAVRLAAMQALYKTELVAHSGDMIPMLA